MQAIWCHEYGPLENLSLEVCDVPVKNSGQVRIGVRAASMSFADTLKIQGKYQVKTPVPFIPGTEAAGEVLEVNSDVEGIRVGDRVLCIMSHSCGAWAEQLVLDADRVLRIPGKMSYEEAASIPSAYGTSYYALTQRGNLKSDETLLVLGAGGGVGLAAVAIGKAMGARVIAAASSSAKLQLARHHGADELINYSCTESFSDAVKHITGGKGADVVYDPIGGALFASVSRAVGFEGRVLVVGFASGDIPVVKLNHILLNGYDLRGVRYDVWRDANLQSSVENMRQVLDWYSEGKITIPVSARFSLAEAQRALSLIVQRRAMGKQVFVIKN